MDFAAFDTRKIDEYTERARAAWGATAEYQEYERKAEGRSPEENASLQEQMMRIFEAFGRVKDGDPASAEAQALVGKLRSFITSSFYNCTVQVLSGLGRMYAAGGEMTENIDRAGGPGTGAFADAAIQVYCAGKRG